MVREDYEDDDVDDDEEIYRFHKGNLSRKRNREGIWEAGIKVYDPKKGGHGVLECACRGSACDGKRVVHAFFACPHCGVIVAEHRAKDIMGAKLSLWCPSCDCHLWVILSGWTDADWEKAK